MTYNTTSTSTIDIFEVDAQKARDKFTYLCNKYDISHQMVGCFFGVSRQAIHSLIRAKPKHNSYNDDFNKHAHSHMFFNLANALITKYIETTQLSFSCDLYISIEDAIEFNRVVLSELPQHLDKYIREINQVLISLETKKGLFEMSQPYKNRVDLIKENIGDPKLDVSKKIFWVISNDILTVKRVTAFLGTNYDNFRRKINNTSTDEFLTPNEYDLCVCFLQLLLDNAEKLVSVDGFGIGKRKILSFVENIDDVSGFCADLAYNIRDNLTKKN